MQACLLSPCQRTRASSFTPCRLTPCMHFELFSSLIVMSFVGLSRPWSIHDWMRSRLTGDISTLNLPNCQPLHAILFSIPRPRVDSRVVLVPPPHRRRDAQWRLSTLEPRGHFAVCMLTLLTPSTRFSLAGSRTTTASYLLAVCAFGVRERGEDRRGALLRGDEERREQWCCSGAV
jgi:hypothetical protein